MAIAPCGVGCLGPTKTNYTWGSAVCGERFMVGVKMETSSLGQQGAEGSGVPGLVAEL